MFTWYNNDQNHRDDGQLESWRDWLNRVGYARCIESGDYGRMHQQVGYHPIYPPDVILFFADEIYFRYFLRKYNVTSLILRHIGGGKSYQLRIGSQTTTCSTHREA